MIVPDVKLLIYAMDEQAPQHDAAWSWWERLQAGSAPPPEVRRLSA